MLLRSLWNIILECSSLTVLEAKMQRAMLNSGRMCLPGHVPVTGMLLNTDHPSFSNTANASSSIRDILLENTHVQALLQNVRIIMGNSLFNCHTLLGLHCAGTPSRADPCAGGTVLSPTGWILAQQVTGKHCRL